MEWIVAVILILLITSLFCTGTALFYKYPVLFLSAVGIWLVIYVSVIWQVVSIGKG